MRTLPCKISSPLLPKKAVHRYKSWATTKLLEVKAILFVLLWQFCVSATNISLNPSWYIQVCDTFASVLFSFYISLIFMFSPLAGLVADIKYGRFKILLLSTYLVLISTILGGITLGIALLTDVQSFGVLGIIIFCLAIIASVINSLGQVLFLSNIVQVGTDQLRDAPTGYSFYYFQAYFWVDSLSNLIVISSHIPGHVIYVDPFYSWSFDKVQTSLLVFFAIAFTLLLFTLLVIQRRYKHWFLSEVIPINPYKLTCNIISFAFHNNKPIRRSAFTFCEDEIPTRLDFAKLRYGGPYTTEQVEDIKSMLNIIKVILSLGLFFFLEGSAFYCILSRNSTDATFSKGGYAVSVMFSFYGLTLDIFSLFLIPVFHCLFGILRFRCLPTNIFKRMGVALVFQTVFYLVYLLYDLLAYKSNNYISGISYTDIFHTACPTNYTYTLNQSLVNIPRQYIAVMQQMIFSVCRVLFYVSLYEFICCQTPQYMKGLMFGLLYAWRALHQFLAAIALYFILYHWKLNLISCQSGFYFLNFCLGVVGVTMYGIAARKYKYRKRDDICNIYQFAEDYYTHGQ